MNMDLTMDGDLSSMSKVTQNFFCSKVLFLIDSYNLLNLFSIFRFSFSSMVYFVVLCCC